MFFGGLRLLWLVQFFSLFRECDLLPSGHCFRVPALETFQALDVIESGQAGVLADFSFILLKEGVNCVCYRVCALLCCVVEHCYSFSSLLLYE